MACTNSRVTDPWICREIEFAHPTGYERIVGELAGVGMRVSATTVAKVLPQASVSPAGARAQLSWRGVLRAQADIFLVINPALCAATIAFIVVYSI